MLSIRIPSTFEIPAGCEGRSKPKRDGDYFVYDVTDEEYMFWAGLTPSVVEELTKSMRTGCFLDVLHSAMRRLRPENYTIEKPVQLD